jgi:hypothetical protein
MAWLTSSRLPHRLLLVDALAILLVLVLLYRPGLSNIGWWGELLAWFAIWFTIYAWMRVRRAAGDVRSLNEQLRGVGLVFVGVIAAGFFWGLFQLGWQTDINDPATRKLGVNALVLTIGYWILSEILTSAERKRLGASGEAIEDERDREVNSRADSVGYTVLIVCLIAAITHIVGGGAFTWRSTPMFDTPSNIAHVLLGILLVTTFIEHAVAVWLYEKDAEIADEADHDDAPRAYDRAA